MSTGLLLPTPRQRFFSDTVTTLPGALLTFYAANTSTLATTYSDSALAVPNANPVVADAAGTFGPIYLSFDTVYDVVLTTAAGVSVWAQEDVCVGVDANAETVYTDICDGRLTLTSGTPVTSSDVTAATTIYFCPYVGNQIALYSGTAWVMHTFSELSLSLAADNASTIYDVFCYSNSGVATLEKLAWTNDSTRATALTRLNGVLVKSGATTRRYLGSYRTTTAAGQSEDSLAKRYVWNAQHRVTRPMQRCETTASWTYTTATFRQANGSTANQLDFIQGVIEEAVIAHTVTAGANTSIGVQLNSAIGVNSTTAVGPNYSTAVATTAVANTPVPLTSIYCGFPGLGRIYLVWLEYSAATGTTTWYGTSAGSNSGISGIMRG
jgi:hypothetical protein